MFNIHVSKNCNEFVKNLIRLVVCVANSALGGVRNIRLQWDHDDIILINSFCTFQISTQVNFTASLLASIDGTARSFMIILVIVWLPFKRLLIHLRTSGVKFFSHLFFSSFSFAFLEPCVANNLSHAQTLNGVVSYHACNQIFEFISEKSLRLIIGMHFPKHINVIIDDKPVVGVVFPSFLARWVPCVHNE